MIKIKKSRSISLNKPHNFSGKFIDFTSFLLFSSFRFQLFRDVILHLPSDKSAKQQMIDVCRQYYQGSDRELSQINEFERTYTKSDCIRWYTRETFVYKMVNKALRTEDIQQLHTFRFYINDLSSKLAEESKTRQMEEDEETSTKIYRGAQLLPNELEQFQSNEGKLISMNGYLSASRLKWVAEGFARNEPRRLNSLSVLFEIECFHSEDQYSIFADITRFSEIPEEQEVLFDIGAVFKIERICPDDQMWKIYLTASNDGQEITREYIEEIKKEMLEESVRILFGSLLTRMGRYDRAETYFYQLLKNPGGENLAQIHNQLGLVYHAKAQFIQAMKHFHLAYELIDQSHRDSAVLLRNISAVLIEQGYHQKALEHSKKAMKVLEELNEECQLEMAHCLQSIGLSYFGLRMYTESLEFSQRALNIKRNCLPENHVHIAESLNSIGMIYLMTKDFERALIYYQLSLEMYQICLPDDHPAIANVFHNIGDYSFHKNQYDQALQYYHLAWIMKKKSLPFDHPSRAMTLNSLSTVYSFKGDKEKALNFCLQALKIREKILPSDHLDLAMSFSSAGHKYEAINDHQLALTYFEKALAIREKFLSTNDPVRKRAERHVIRMKRKIM